MCCELSQGDTDSSTSYMYILLACGQYLAFDDYTKGVSTLRETGRCFSCAFFFLRFYLFIHERHIERQRRRQREKQALHKETDAGLDPRPRDHTLS